MQKVRRIGVMIGSDSDLQQCVKGLRYLMQQEQKGRIVITHIDTNSQHRHTEIVQERLREYAQMPDDQKVDILIIGAG